MSWQCTTLANFRWVAKKWAHMKTLTHAPIKPKANTPPAIYPTWTVRGPRAGRWLASRAAGSTAPRTGAAGRRRAGRCPARTRSRPSLPRTCPPGNAARSIYLERSPADSSVPPRWNTATAADSYSRGPPPVLTGAPSTSSVHLSPHLPHQGGSLHIGTPRTTSRMQRPMRIKNTPPLDANQENCTSSRRGPACRS